MEEPTKEFRRFYVKTADLDPAAGRIGFADGCKGCIATITGKSRAGHEDGCRFRVVEKASSDPSVATPVKVARGREQEWHAKKLEENETSKRKPEEKTGDEVVAGADPPASDERVAGAKPPIGKRKPGHQGDEGQAPDQIGGSSSSSQAVVTAGAFLEVRKLRRMILRRAWRLLFRRLVRRSGGGPGLGRL